MGDKLAAIRESTAKAKAATNVGAGRILNRSQSGAIRIVSAVRGMVGKVPGLSSIPGVSTPAAGAAVGAVAGGWRALAVEIARACCGGAYEMGSKVDHDLKWPECGLDAVLNHGVGLDCSGLTEGCIRLAGGPCLPDGSANQRAALQAIDENAVLPGDCLFGHNAEGAVHHVALCTGEGTVIEAIGEKWGIGETSIDRMRQRYAKDGGRISFGRVGG